MIILKLFTVILLTLFLWLLLQLFISAFRVFSFFKAGVRQAAEPVRPSAAQQNTMVKCAACHLYVMDTDAIVRNGMHFCSLDHARNS